MAAETWGTIDLETEPPATEEGAGAPETGLSKVNAPEVDPSLQELEAAREAEEDLLSPQGIAAASGEPGQQGGTRGHTGGARSSHGCGHSATEDIPQFTNMKSISTKYLSFQ